MSPFGIMWSPVLFGLALFFSSALLFLVQPMLGRTLVPLLGGNPVAWNVCLVFFQTTLLAGYVYADLMHRFRGLRWQPWLHFFLLATGVTLCFVGLFGDHLLGRLGPRLTSLESSPILTTTCLLIVVIGLPFFAVAAVSPLVQRWFAHLDHPKSSDPYFLLVASNLGGLMALVIYPLMIEPLTPLYAQWLSWKLAVTALGVLLFMTALCAWRSPRSAELEPAQAPSDPEAPLVPKLIGRGPATWPRRLLWFVAASIPVALLMAVTDFLTMETALTPILWAVPLALYLIAFCQSYARFSPLQFGNNFIKISLHVVFGLTALFVAMFLFAVLFNPDPGRNRDGAEAMLFLACALSFAVLMLTPFTWLWVLQPISALGVVFAQASWTGSPALEPGPMMLYLACFYLSVRLCLGMLANDRPAAPALTAYYGWIGLGGLAGGLFQLLLAPLLFTHGFLEISLLAALASMVRTSYVANGMTDWLMCLMVMRKSANDPDMVVLRRRIGVCFDNVFALFTACLVGSLLLAARGAAWEATHLDLAFVGGLGLVVALAARPWRFGLALALVVAMSSLGTKSETGTSTVVQSRTSRGLVHVTEHDVPIRLIGGLWGDRPIPDRFTERRLMLGGAQQATCIIEPPEMTRYPTGVYHRKSPVGQVMRRLEWFAVPGNGVPLDREMAVGWLRRNRDNVKDDARIAASLVGLTAMPGLSPVPMDALVAAWSEPPIAIVGLGAGALLTYAHPFQCVDVYEVDSTVIELSTKTPAVFPYLQQAKARGVNVRIFAGDPRRNLAKPDCEGFYHAIFVDAACASPLPVHLLTKQAVELYLHKMTPDGIVCLRTSHRHFNLAPVVEEQARALKLMSKVLHNDTAGDDPTLVDSEWVVLARTPIALQKWTAQAGYERNNGPLDPVLLPRAPRPPVPWTDEHANVLSAARRGQGWPILVNGLLVLMLFFGIVLGLVEIVFVMVRFSPK